MLFQLTTIIRWLENPDERFFGVQPIAGRDAFLRTTFEMAIEELKVKLGDSIDHWRYGQEKYKHIALVNYLSGLLSEEAKRKVDLGPMPRGGNGHTPNATGSSDNQSSGASFRIIVDVGDWDKTLMINTPGQSADPFSPFYGTCLSCGPEMNIFLRYSREKIEEGDARTHIDGASEKKRQVSTKNLQSHKGGWPSQGVGGKVDWYYLTHCRTNRIYTQDFSQIQYQ